MGAGAVRRQGCRVGCAVWSAAFLLRSLLPLCGGATGARGVCNPGVVVVYCVVCSGCGAGALRGGGAGWRLCYQCVWPAGRLTKPSKVSCNLSMSTHTP